MRRIKHSLLAWAATTTNALASNVTLTVDHDAQPFGRGVLQTSEAVTISPSAPLLGSAVLSTDITITLDQADTFSAAAVLATTETITITPPALLAGIGLLDTDEPITIAGPTGLNAAGLLDSSAGFTLSPPTSIDGAGNLSLTTALTLSSPTSIAGAARLSTDESLTLTPSAQVIGVGVLSTTTALTIAGPTSFAATAVLDTDVTLAFDWSGSDIVDAGAATTLSSNVSLIVTPSALLTGAGLMSTRIPNGIHLNGATKIRQVGALGGVTNTPRGILSLWLQYLTAPLTSSVYLARAEPGGVFVLDIGGPTGSVPFTPHIFIENPAGSLVLNLGVTPGTSHLTDDRQPHHWLAAWDLDANIAQFYYDGVLIRSYSPGNVGHVCNYAGPTTWYIGAGTSGHIVGDLRDFYLNTDEYVDISDAGIRARFYNSGHVDLGPDGSLPTGNQPALFLSGPKEEWLTNKGYATTNLGAVTAIPKLSSSIPTQLEDEASFEPIDWIGMDVDADSTAFALVLSASSDVSLTIDASNTVLTYSVLESSVGLLLDGDSTALTGVAVLDTDVSILLDADGTTLGTALSNALFSFIQLSLSHGQDVAGAAVLDTTETLTVTPTVSMSGVAVLDTDETTTISVAADVSGAGLLSSTETLTLSPNVDGSAVAVLDTTEALLINFSGNDIALRALLTSIVTVTMDSNADLVAVGPLTSEVRLFLGMYGRAGVNWYNPPRGTLRSVTSVTGTLKEYELVTGTIRDTSIITKRIGSD